jgi:hypothetical protein
MAYSNGLERASPVPAPPVAPAPAPLDAPAPAPLVAAATSAPILKPE